MTKAEIDEWKEHGERLHAMAVDDGDTWDLSENDQAACNAGGDAIMALLARADEPVSALSSAPPDLVPEHVRKHSREVVDMYRGLRPSEQVSRGTLAAMAIGLLERWLAPAPPVAETPECAGPFVSAFDCPKCDPRRTPASPVVAPAPVVEDAEKQAELVLLEAMLAQMIQDVTARRDMAAVERGGTDADEAAGAALAKRMTGRALPARTRAEREAAAARHDRIADGIEAKGNALMSAITALRYEASPRETPDGGGR